MSNQISTVALQCTMYVKHKWYTDSLLSHFGTFVAAKGCVTHKFWKIRERPLKALIGAFKWWVRQPSTTVCATILQNTAVRKLTFITHYGQF